MRQGYVKRLILRNSIVNFKAGTAYSLGYLPEEYRSTRSLTKFIVIAGNTSVIYIGRIILATDGEVTFVPYIDRSNGAVIYIDETYI